VEKIYPKIDQNAPPVNNQLAEAFHRYHAVAANLAFAPLSGKTGLRVYRECVGISWGIVQFLKR
jgi:hypothetical protein